MTGEEILKEIMEPASETAYKIVYRHISPEKLAAYLSKLEEKIAGKVDDNDL